MQPAMAVRKQKIVLPEKSVLLSVTHSVRLRPGCALARPPYSGKDLGGWGCPFIDGLHEHISTIILYLQIRFQPNTHGNTTRPSMGPNNVGALTNSRVTSERSFTEHLKSTGWLRHLSVSTPRRTESRLMRPRI